MWVETTRFRAIDRIQGPADKRVTRLITLPRTDTSPVRPRRVRPGARPGGDPRGREVVLQHPLPDPAGTRPAPKNEYNNLPKLNMEAVLSNWRHVRRWCLEEGYVECDGVYAKGSKAFGYRFGTRLRASTFRLVPVTDKGIRR